MIIYHPKDLYSSLKIWTCLVDFLIEQLKEDRLMIACSTNRNDRLLNFKIYLVKNFQDIKKEVRLNFSYNDIWGCESSTPIERFHIELSQGCISVLAMRSQNPQEYDKMLELFMACLDHLERNDPQRHKAVIEVIDIESLKRSNWKKSVGDIEKEVASSISIRTATDDLQRKIKSTLEEAVSRYRHQGYEITS